MNDGLFEQILKNHGIKIINVIDDKTFEVESVLDEDNSITETVHFETFKELLVWLGY